MQERPPAKAQLRFREEAERIEKLPLAERFGYIYDTNLWGSEESRSGLGSAVDETAHLRGALAELLRQIGVSSILDIPCGDYGWMSQAGLQVEYTGADIVAVIVERNRTLYPGNTFLQLDLTRDTLPRADLVLCRDCLVHLSFANVFRALRQIRESGAEWLLATTFLEHESNQDIPDGDWRMLNLERAPFNFARPEAVIVEGCTEAGGAYADKALGLWRVSGLPPL
ncbi:MAG TPA: class I SAM-dependent methyltransferase [Bryobacteraceae bacterium]|nr:class I SAM-dependent methyltransferase [Bryobacteraceae bacterium]